MPVLWEAGAGKEAGQPSYGFSYRPLPSSLVTRGRALGLRGPGSRGVAGEPDGLFRLFSKL